MPANRKARAIYDYDARAPDELTFKRNDLIEVFGLDEEDEGWYKGRLNGIEGLFPNNYVHFMEEVPAPAAAPSKPTSSGPVAPTPPPTTPPAPAASGLPESVKVQKFEASYALAEVLGRGRFSQVRRCTHTASKRSCAVKIMELVDPELGANEKDAEKEILAEVKVLRMVQHANIVELLETIKEGKRYHLVLEDLDGGDLFDRIEQNGPYKEDDAALLMRQVVTAVDYLHAKGIVHRDLKPDNLVFTTKAPDARMKIIDFGYAGFCSASAPLRGLCGTPDYAAPEILTWYVSDKSRKPSGSSYSQPVDMWSLGVVLYIVLCGFPPFYGDDDEQMFELIRAGTYAFPEAIDGYRTTWATVSDQAKGVIRNLLTVPPQQRATAPQVLEGEWLTTKGTPRGAGWVGKMRERSNSGWRAAATAGAPASASQPRQDRGQIDRGDAPIQKPSGPVNTDAKMVFANESEGGDFEGKLKFTLEQKGLVSQFSRWLVDRLVKREMRILMLGLDNSGKTSILYRLKLGQPKRTVPTIGFNVETLEYKNIAFTVWDVGGQEKLRALWHHYFASAQALIFVVDSSDRARLTEAAAELHRLIKEEELHNSLLLVLANKQDLPNACNAAEISQLMKLYPPHISRSCYIQSCCATSGDGLHEGLDWLSSNMPDDRDK